MGLIHDKETKINNRKSQIEILATNTQIRNLGSKEYERSSSDRRGKDAVEIEMKNNRVAFEPYEGKLEDLIGYEEISGHLIFDVKLSENFWRKASFVADGHLVETLASITYSTVVSRDSVRILLMVGALNDLDVMGCDVQNAFLSADNLEKHWIRAGPEFRAEQGKIFIVVQVLYGLKSASAAFRSFMAKKLDEIGFKSTHANPDVWIRPADFYCRPSPLRLEISQCCIPIFHGQEA